jgi:hypothetical protein
VATTFFVLLALVADLIYVGITLSGELQTSATQLNAARSAIADNDIVAVRHHLDASQEAVDRALASARHPAFAIARLTPDGRALDALTAAVDLATRAGNEALAATRTLDLDGGDLGSSLFEDGRVRLEPLTEASQDLLEAQELLIQAYDGLLTAPPDPWLDEVEDALATAEARFLKARVAVSKALILSETLPPMLGSSGPRRYLLAFTAPGEARATGGILGLYGSTEADSGRLSLTEFGPSRDLVPSEPVTTGVSAWFAKAYRQYESLEDPRQANVSPSFPAAATVWLAMYEARTGETLDGVVSMDPITLSLLMPALDPIDVGDRTVTSKNVLQTLLYDVYTEFDTIEQEAFLGELVDEFWSRIQAGQFDGPLFARGIGEAARTGHLRVFDRELTNQEALAGLGVIGEPARNSQMVFHNSYGANKVDAFLHREIRTTVRPQGGGGALVESVITLRNDAPSGPRSLLLGPPPDEIAPEGLKAYPPGLNRMVLSVLLPEGAGDSQMVSAERGRISPYITRERGRNVVWQLLQIPPGESETVTLSYKIMSSSADDDFSMTLEPQNLVNPDEFSLRVIPPPGYVLVFDGSEVAGALEITGVLDEPKPVHVELDEEG